MDNILVCTLGGSPQPLLVSIDNLLPQHIVFVASALSSKQIPDILSALNFTPTHDVIILDDEQNMVGCLKSISDYIALQNTWWQAALENRLYVDFTGGTKAMVAAIALAFSKLPVIFRYVGGAFRSKNGLGATYSGTEFIVNQKNPLQG